MTKITIVDNESDKHALYCSTIPISRARARTHEHTQKNPTV